MRTHDGHNAMTIARWPSASGANDRKQRKSLTALRINAHKLKTECGRYAGQSKEERLCAECNVVEDEINIFVIVINI